MFKTLQNNKMRPKCTDVQSLYDKNKDLKKEDVQKFREWLNMQPHLPHIDEMQLIHFLHSCYFSNEAAKVTLDNYYTARTHCPEFFANRNPTGQELQTAIKTIVMTPLPKLTPEGYAITYFKLIDTNPDQYSLNSLLKYFDMVSSLTRQELGPVEGHIILVDYQGFSLGHLLKMNVVSIKKYMFFLQEALPLRLKGMHYVNAVSFMDKVLALIKPFMKKELLDVFHIHQGNNETVYKYIPKECLPNEIGGSCGPILEINRGYNKNFEENVEYFLEEEKVLVDESMRPGKPKSGTDLFGVEGTFKKLDID